MLPCRQGFSGGNDISELTCFKFTEGLTKRGAKRVTTQMRLFRGAQCSIEIPKNCRISVPGGKVGCDCDDEGSRAKLLCPNPQMINMEFTGIPFFALWEKGFGLFL